MMNEIYCFNNIKLEKVQGAKLLLQCTILHPSKLIINLSMNVSNICFSLLLHKGGWVTSILATVATSTC